MVKGTTEEMLSRIRDAIRQCHCDECAVYAALVEEAESWKMRLEELEEEEDE